MPRTKSGLDILVEEQFARLRGLRVGVLAHAASVDARLRHVVDLMRDAGLRLEVLLGPEHGIHGDAQDMEVVEEAHQARDSSTGARVYSLYGSAIESLHPTPAMLDGLDVLVVDLQDVGARYYTFVATMAYAMRVAGRIGLRVLVLDRPNPIGGLEDAIEGPALEPAFHSFVGDFDVPTRHGLTIGEFARHVRALEAMDVDLEVVAMEGWSREMAFEDTGLPWVLPSPNMPTVDTAWVYPGQCLLEGTNMSEGRGTTRPFELFGAPYLDGRALVARAAPSIGPGFVLRPTVIRPTFQKHAKKSAGGAQVHVTDRRQARSMRLTVALLEAARSTAPDGFDWRRERYEYVSDRLAIDLLFGSDQPRKMLEAGASTDDVLHTFRKNESTFVERRRSSLLY